ncbi:hypothetical protein QE152_g40722 [Popillia japonica]|uniref:Uncharacterized protein n=1 Tax=Popillia japonica TaxID=7064 RepID=A0AAW1HFY3_POPJA
MEDYYVCSLTSNNVIAMPIRNRFYKRMVYYTTYAVLVPLICTMFFIIGNKGYYSLGRFTPTVRYFLQTRRNVNNFVDSFVHRKKIIYETQIIIVKLALLMGITWIYYIYSYINSIQNNEIAQHIGDIIGFANTFEGVYFLLIFAVKDAIRHKVLSDGYGMMYGGNFNCPRSLWKEFSEVKPQIRADGVLTIDNSPTEYKLNDYCLGTNYDTTTGQIHDMIFYCEFREALYVKWKFNEVATVITVKWKFNEVATVITCIAFVLTIAIYVFVYRLIKLHQQLICCFCLVDLTFWVMYALRIFDVKFGKFCITFGNCHL